MLESSSTLYGGRLIYHGVDVEDTARRALRNFCVRSGTRLSAADSDDAVAYLCSEGWTIAGRFDANRGAPFKSVLYQQVSLRCVDFMRKRFGRTKWQFATHTYERDLQVPLSLDGPGGGADGHSLGEFVSDRSGGGEDVLSADGPWREPESVGERMWCLALVRAAARRLDEERATASRGRRYGGTR